MDVADTLSAIEGVRLFRDVSLAGRTTYHVGGPARLFVRADTSEGLVRVLSVLGQEGIPTLVLGGGSNVLVSDEGFAGCVIALGESFSAVEVDGARIVAGGSAHLSSVVSAARRAGLHGLEYCAGIPGSVGGAVRMDAGSRSEWIGQRIEAIEVATSQGVRVLQGSQVEWGYRRSSLARDAIVLSCSLSLERSTTDEVAREIACRLARRRATQPLDKPSCGSFFRNPDGASVGRIIEKCGCKGYAIGDARVSDVHANFIVNEGHARAADVLAVGQHVHDVVLDSRGIDLVPEVRIVGFEPRGIARGDA